MLPFLVVAAALSVPEFKSVEPSSGTFLLLGTVASVYVCPPCPDGAMCKPCAPAHIVVTDDSKKQVLLRTKEEKLPLKKGGRYLFTVEFRDREAWLVLARKAAARKRGPR